MSNPPAVVEEDQALNQRIDARLESRIALLESRLVMREEFDRRVAEVEKRADETITRLIAERVTLIEEKLDERVKLLTNDVNRLFTRLDEWMNGADARIDARTGEVKLLRSDLSRNEDITLVLDRRQRNQHERLKKLHATIHGDPEIKDGPPSLFDMVAKVGEELERANNLTTQEIDASALLIAQHSSWIKAFEEERARQKALWERRKQVTSTLLNWGLKSKPGQVLIVALIVASFYSFAPDLAARLLTLLNP